MWILNSAQTVRVASARHQLSNIQHPASKIRLSLLRILGLALAARSSTAPLPAAARVLIIRPDHLGDLLLSAPAVGLLRRALPRARLTYLVGPWSEEVARRGPCVDEVLTCAFPGFTRRPKPSPLQPYQLLLAQAARLRGRHDAALVLRPDHWWGALLAAAASIPLRVGSATPECAPFLTHSLEEETTSYQLASVAIARRLLELAPATDKTAAPRSEPFHIREDERVSVQTLLADHGVESDQPLVCLHPGSGARLKLWATERWGEVGRALAVRLGVRVAVTGAPDEHELAMQVAHAIGAGAVGLAGRTTLGQLAAVLERARLAIGPDNGPLHLAAAVGTPTVRLLGPTDPDRFMPVGLPDQYALTVELPCRPCGMLEKPPCGALENPACLADIEVGRVIKAAALVLERANARAVRG